MQNNTICHVEWHTTDLERASKFYAQLFGWTFSPHGDTYWMFHTPEGVGGAFAKTEKVEAGASPTVYVWVANVADHLQKAAALGAQIHQPLHPISDTENIGIFKDHDGNLVGLYDNSNPSQ